MCGESKRRGKGVFIWKIAISSPLCEGIENARCVNCKWGTECNYIWRNCRTSKLKLPLNSINEVTVCVREYGAFRIFANLTRRERERGREIKKNDRVFMRCNFWFSRFRWRKMPLPAPLQSPQPTPSPSLFRSWSLQMHLHDQTAETSCKLQAARLLWLSVTVTRCPGIMQKKRKIARLLRLLARGAAASRHRHWDRQIDRRIKTAHALCGCAAQWNESQANLSNPNKCVTFIGKSLKNCLQTHLTTGEGGWGDWNMVNKNSTSFLVVFIVNNRNYIWLL